MESLLRGLKSSVSSHLKVMQVVGDAPIDRVHLFPVRHHSPRACAVLADALARVDPDCVLVEGPEDGNALMEVLVSEDTVPPVALLAYRTDGTPGSSAWPFVTYSPEYAALKWAHARGRVARFIDVTAGQSLAESVRESGDAAAPGLKSDPELEGNTANEDAANENAGAQASEVESMDPHRLVANKLGFRSFEEFWEASFEAPQYREDAFRAALMAYAELTRHESPLAKTSRARDAIMRRAIQAVIDSGTPPEKIFVVLGAAHAAAIVAGDVEDSRAALFEGSVPTAMTLIPYSFPRLAEQTGYGAGNRAPFFHQRAHNAGADYQRAALEVFVDFTDHMRLRGYSVSLADTIEGYRLACQLAVLRGKSGPGLDEIKEATVATLCRGEAMHIDEFLWSSVVGKGVGRVAKGVGKNSLQEEFWRLVAHFRLPKSDDSEMVGLRLSDPVHVAISTFLHRLRMLGVPYASLTGESGDGLEALSRSRENWQCQWTPSSELALIEAIVHGESLVVAAERILEQSLSTLTSVRGATLVLVKAVVADAPVAISLALRACEHLGATDDSLSSLASACRALAGLVSYGSNREKRGADEKVLRPLLEKMFARATMRLPYAARASESEAAALTEALRVLHELAQTQRTLDTVAWIAEMRACGASFDVLARCAGTAAGLLLLSGHWSDAEAHDSLSLRMTAHVEPARTTEFLVGFLEVNALAIVRNRPIVEILDEYVQSLSREAFWEAAPMLRRAFADLGKTERRYLVESLVGIHPLGAEGDAVLATRVVTEKDAAELRAVSEGMAKAMDDLDDLL